MSRSDFEAVIGLEVHAELRTKTKIFCSCPTDFGAEPNTQCCPICMGLPGSMPSLNRRVVELAAMAGLALHCTVSPISRTDRKQYFYPDLPKAYQISQGEVPLCRNGYLVLKTAEGERRIGISRIHIEEDAGKLMHENGKTLIDYNRSGVPLIEIVSEPHLRSGREAADYLRTLRAILVSCGVTDGKMQEGSLRCDVNVSVRPVGMKTFGVRTEIKNLNSFTFVEKAIEYEIARQIALIERGEGVRMETRRYDAVSGETVLMRRKEQAEDYRFIVEPDLPPILLTETEIEALRQCLPEFPDARAARLVREYGLAEKDARTLCQDVALGNYFEAAAKSCAYPRLVSNLLLSELLRHCDGAEFVSPVSADRLAALADLMGEGTVNSATVKKLLLRLCEGDFDPRLVVEQEDLGQIRDKAKLRTVALEVIAENPRAVADYRNGKNAALRSLQGRLMAKTGGRAEPILSEKIMKELLKEEV
ncbi:MAG: Asp-tRNA(Asn)/Glu-tRNA(Gln) amidotransferase subunit GatB [Clostridia bacterium]|nr:Asp-tRNA(Asn)/Glu-tRNA(Gln) amidotransferase subunit GatB [Clostridia bacterium]